MLTPCLVRDGAGIGPVTQRSIGAVQRQLTIRLGALGRQSVVDESPHLVVELDPEEPVEVALLDLSASDVLHEGVPAGEPVLAGKRQLGVAQREALAGGVRQCLPVWVVAADRRHVVGVSSTSTAAQVLRL